MRKTKKRGQDVRPQKQGGREEKRKVEPQAYVVACGSDCTRTVLSLATARGLASLLCKQKLRAVSKDCWLTELAFLPGGNKPPGASAYCYLPDDETATLVPFRIGGCGFVYDMCMLPFGR